MLKIIILEVLLASAGKDATKSFNKADHTRNAKSLLENYKIGVVKKLTMEEGLAIAKKT